VAVIGAGMSGLVTAKELLDEGLQVTIFEKADRVGGNFSTGAAYERMKLTVSNYFMAFSSLPPPAGEERRFWTRDEYVEYLNRFVATFGLLSLVRFMTEVQSVRRIDEQSFQVTSMDAGGAVHHELFSAVAFCRGAHRIDDPNRADYPGAADFGGPIVHAAQWRGPEPFRGRRVVCVGMGETSADITREISDVAAACWLSMRSYPYLIPRYNSNSDGANTNDSLSARITHWAPREVLVDMRQQIEDQLADRLSPQDRIIYEWNKKANPGRFYQKNCDFIENVLSGKIVPIFSDIKQMEPGRVTFDNGDIVEADAVMLCTGFRESSIPDQWLPGYGVDDVRRLYKHQFHPQLGWRVAFIGWARPIHGGVPAASELQARLFALLCSGKAVLPAGDDLRAAIEEDVRQEDELTRGSPHIRTLVHYTRYLDSMAELVGCRPEMGDYLEDPELLYKLLFGSNIGACYRLRGPHADPEAAREVIMRLPVAIERSYVYRRLLPRLAPISLREALGESLAVQVEEALRPFLQAGGRRGIYLDDDALDPPAGAAPNGAPTPGEAAVRA